MGQELLKGRVATDDGEWKGTSRYEVVGNLGRGGMGAVYEVLDHERQELIAVKTVLRFDAASLYLFKKEFRTLTDVHHPNLVHLYELVVPEAGQIFFTMELVRGRSFIDHVRTGGLQAVARAESAVVTVRAAHVARTHTGEDSASDPPSASESKRFRSPADFARLRPTLVQLVEGVAALHRAGKLHRDLKPSNVLVTREGRVVILDFGVATELTLRSGADAERGEIVGTATYMAPEQAFDEPPTVACDWYSVGVMLYEALVGGPPFTGPAMDVLQRKTMTDPVAPSLCVDGIPADLEALCLSLLDREPAARPPYEEILRRLGVKHSSAPPMSTQATESAVELTGRDEQLRDLAHAFDVVRAGKPVAVHVAGPSGMGKSSLVHHFLDDLARRGEAVVLRGRAYERESVPYKAVDSIIDALSGHILRLAEAGDPLELPEDAWALGRLFPVLLRVPGVDKPSEEPSEDPKVVRQRAFGALREIVSALAARQPIVVFVDDVHWGDVDSATLLLELTRPPEAPPILLLMTHRDAEAAASPFLIELGERWPDQAEQRTITVGPLDVTDSRRLALALLGADEAVAGRTARAVARESRGSPFLIEELVRSNRGTGAADAQSLTTLTLEQIVAERLDRLPEAARRLVDVIAVSGRPLPISVATDASDLDAGGAELVSLVCARRFARTGLRGGREVIEMVHERIRETVVAQQEDAAARALHRRLALALETGASGDSEAIALHWLAVPDDARGAHFAGIAAEQAATKLAFDKAARLFRLTLEHTPNGSPRVHRLRGRLAEVLCLGGRYEESGRAYIAAAENAPPDERLEFQRAAAQQLLTAGRLDEGSKALHELLGALGMRAPRSTLVAVIWIIVYRVWLAIRGLRFQERSVSDVSLRDRLRIDALSTVSVGFSVIDLALSNCMQSRHLIEALRAGDSRQVMRAAAIDGSQRAATGRKPTKDELKLNEIARTLAEREGTFEAQAFFCGAHGMGMFQRGHWQLASELLDRGLKAGNFSTVGYSNLLIFGANVTMQRGSIREAAKRRNRHVAQARDRGDLYTAVTLQTGIGVHCSLAADDPATARRDIHEALRQWSRSKDDFHVQHWQAVMFEADVDLYEGDGAAAYERIERNRSTLGRSFLLHSGFIRTLTHYSSGRACIALLAKRPEQRARRIADALAHAKALEREHDLWTKVPAKLLRACAANAAGDRAATIAALREAVELGRATGSGLYLQPAIYRLGKMLGDEEGRALVAGVEATLKAEGVRDVPRWVRVYLPGAWETESETDPPRP